jgi:hypothetical protein
MQFIAVELKGQVSGRIGKSRPAKQLGVVSRRHGLQVCLAED